MDLNRCKMTFKNVQNQRRRLLLGSVDLLPNDLFGEVITLNENT